MKRGVGIGVLATILTVAATPAAGDLPDIPAPYLFIDPTIGVWRWDEFAPEVGRIIDRTQPVFGARGGFAPVPAFGVEIVALTGKNDVSFLGTPLEGQPSGLRLTQLELSFVVGLRGLAVARLYPMVMLGGGLSLRSADANTAEVKVFDGTKFNFHLGFGIKADLNPLSSIRFQARDTFYTEQRGVAGNEEQVTVDSVELTVAFEYRIPTGGSGGSKRLR